jgi:sugar fermentation stimulation protein A
MKFKTKLIEGKFLKRYKRFFADIDIGIESPEIVVAHNVNTGSMKTCIGENWKSLISFHDSPTRKLKYTFEMIHNGKSWIGINTSLTNSLAAEAILNGTIVELQGYKNLKPEAKIGDSRIDILLSNDESDLCYVEVKNVTMVEDQFALFPDAVTERGQKHLNELMNLKSQGIRAVMLFVVQREDCHTFKVENEIDKKYSELLKKSILNGVEILVYQCSLTSSEIKIIKKLPIK